MPADLPPSLLDEALELVRRHWTEWVPGEHAPRRLDHVVQGTGVGKLIVYVLAPDRHQAALVLKLPRSARDCDELLHEYGVITELRQRGGAVAESLPRPLAAPTIQGWPVVVEAMLPGELFTGLIPAGERFSLEAAAQQLRSVREWLVSLHLATRPEPRPLDAADIEALFLAPVRRATAEAELRPHELDFAAGLAEAARQLLGRPLALGFVHGDLRPGNILVHQGRLRVLDWQFGTLRGLPLMDWFEFAFRYYCNARGLEEITGNHDDYRAAFADVFLGAHPYTRLMEAETQACANALGIDRNTVELLLGMWLVDGTNKYLDFLTERAEHGYVYLMKNPPGGPLRSFRQQLRRQLYPCLLGQLAQSRGAQALYRASANGAREAQYPAR